MSLTAFSQTGKYTLIGTLYPVIAARSSAHVLAVLLMVSTSLLRIVAVSYPPECPENTDEPHHKDKLNQSFFSSSAASLIARTMARMAALVDLGPIVRSNRSTALRM